MSTLILFDKTNNNWSSLGLGPLTDAKNPIVDRERNGIYTLSFQYPVFSPLFKELKIGRWIVADAGPTKQAKSQRFEIETITKPIDGIITVYCEHYRYQLIRSIVKKFDSVLQNISAQAALNQLGNNMLPQGDFNFYSDVGSKTTLDLSDPSKFKNAQEVLGGVQGSILDNFGGEYVFDNNQVRLLASAGSETNVIIAYGKNLTDITQEENIGNTYTSVYGWAKNQETEEIMVLPESIIDSDYVGNYTQRRVLMVDFSEDEPKSVETLRNLVKAYIKNNNIGIPKVSIKTSFEDLASSVLADELKTIETLDLCDTVTIAFKELGINTTSKIIKTSWNVALDKYDSIELGEAQTDFGKVMAESEKNTNQILNKVDWLEKAQKEASDILRNPGEGHVVIYPSIADPQEILIMDTTNVNTAKNVWRWNAGGLGFSSTGYNGTYGLAMTNNGAIVADRMTTGILRAIKMIGVTMEASTIVSSSSSTDIMLNDGKLTFIDKNNGRIAATLDTSSNGSNSILTIGASKDNDQYKGQFSFASYFANLEIKSYDGNYNSELGLGGGTGTSRNGHAYVGNYRKRDSDFSGLQVTGEEVFIEGSNLRLVSTNGIVVFSNIDMNGNKITNQSDIRLKENIVPSQVDGIAETKKLAFYDFNRKQNYLYKEKSLQPPREKELGIIAQYSEFLVTESKNDHYLRIDTGKQIMLNTLTNKQLIEIIENQEERLKKIEQALNMDEEVENGQ
ncbi:phage tail protein [Enterococcus sp. ALS3]|uniref:Phage tail protein n=1 Tax=Enterococcus alishanensis TaxID=1303817 RepID=A0ABS6TDS0_9ENTE|nr:phage tail spike protein [Enterococcus alishanensis]MBV7391048.1 phage tail protein [Enterococcus alishanensis]